MLFLLEILAFIAWLWALAFYAAPRKLWVPAVIVALLLLTIFSVLHWFILFIVWALFLGIAACAMFSWIRHRFITSPLLRYFKRVLPPISATEREAIEAGDIGWEGELFRGAPDWDALSRMPKPLLTGREQSFIDTQVETLCALIDDWRSVQEAALSPEVWDYLKKEGFFGLAIPEQYGGHGFSTLAHSHVVTKIATRSASVAVTVMVPNALGPAEFLQHFGTEEQKAYYLPRLASGEEIPAFGLTSPEAGSDAANIPDTGIVCKGDYEGREVLGIRLNWDKRYITLAPVCTLLGLAFKLYDPEQLLSEQHYIGITLCLIPTHLPGVEIGKRHFPAGLAFLNGPTRGKDVFIPLEFIIGGSEMRGRGWRMMMEALAVGRGISLPALATATTKLCYRMTGAYCSLREQFNQPIGHFEGISTVLARIGGLTYLSEATRLFTLAAIAADVKPAIAAAITKYHLTEMARTVVNDAMDIHAGRAVQLGPRNYLSFLYQAVPISITVEGANILTRNLIIFGQGAIRCHPYLQAEIAAATVQNPKESLHQFDVLLMKHIGYTIHNLARVFVYGLTCGYFIDTPVQDILGKYYRQLTRMSAVLAFVSDVVLAVYGGGLKRKEQLSAGLGDVLSYLYLASAVLKYYQHQNKPQEDLPFVVWGLEKCLYDIQTALVKLLNNFKPRWLARIISWLVFPWGKPYHQPRDATEFQIAAIMMRPSQQRDRITEYCYVGQERDDITGRIEHAFRAIELARPARTKLREAIVQRKIDKKATFYQQIDAAKQLGILTEEELTALQEFAVLRRDAIQVDEFDGAPNKGIGSVNP